MIFCIYTILGVTETQLVIQMLHTRRPGQSVLL